MAEPLQSDQYNRTGLVSIGLASLVLLFVRVILFHTPLNTIDGLNKSSPMQHLLGISVARFMFEILKKKNQQSVAQPTQLKKDFQFE